MANQAGHGDKHNQVCCICCICKEFLVVTETTKYTNCCAEAVCEACLADLKGLKDLSLDCNPKLQCLSCQQPILYQNLLKPNSLPQSAVNFELILTNTVNKLQRHIQAYSETIAKLRADLNDNYAVMADFSRDNLVGPDQELAGVVKPLQITIQDNIAILTRLQYLKQQLLNLNFNHNVDHGRLLHLDQIISQHWRPITMVIGPLWHCRHPLGSILTTTDLAKTLTSGFTTQQRLDFDLPNILRDFYLTKCGYPSDYMNSLIDHNSIIYHEITAGKFVVLVNLNSGWLFICAPILPDSQPTQYPPNRPKLRQQPPNHGKERPRLKPARNWCQWQILVYLTDSVAGSVRINANYLVYQSPAGPMVVYQQDFVTRLGRIGPADQDVSESSLGQATLIDFGATSKLLSLEKNQLWCYCRSKELRCYDLTDPTNYQSHRTPGLDLISFSRGIYVTLQSKSRQAPQILQTSDDYYYQVRSLNYPEALIETSAAPKLYCDGSVVYQVINQNGQIDDRVCTREDLTGSRVFTSRENRQLLLKTEISSTGQLFGWSTTHKGELIIRRYN